MCRPEPAVGSRCDADPASAVARRVRSRLLLVEALEPEVAPSAASLSWGGTDGLVKQPVADLRTLWRRALLEVRDCLDRVMDPTAFCQVRAGVHAVTNSTGGWSSSCWKAF